MPKFYQSYLLRIWKTEEEGTIRWKASLEDPHTRVVIPFLNKEALFRYLEELTEDKNKHGLNKEGDI